jgi:protein involved in polysaccharide export with SLBB domain
MNILKHFLFYLITFSSLYVSSQSVNSDFLDSLPDELKEELENEQNASKENLEMETLFNSNTSLEKTSIILKRVKTQLDLLEKRVEDEINGQSSGGLEIFGSDFFKSFATSFSAINVPNYDGSYIIDVGDTFKIGTVGVRTENIDVTVNRDGSLYFADYGKLFVAGLSLDDVEAKIQNFFKLKSIGTEVIIQLVSLRDMQVIIIGSVELPGVYTLSGGSGVLAALNAAGGVSDSGSYRKIEVTRKGKLIKSIDLYDLLVFGNTSVTDFQLRSGDVLSIKPASFHVSISGGISVPAIYEINNGETLANLIEYAGGFSQDFYGFDTFNLYRGGKIYSNYIEVDANNISSIELKPRDTVIVPSYNNDLNEAKIVEIKGRVKNPGTYFINDGDTLSVLIDRAGGYLDDAYLYGGALFRKSSITKAEKFAALDYQDIVSYVVSSIGRPNSVVNQQVLPLLQEELSSKTFEGRIITNFDLAKIESDPSLDIELQDGDRIIIPTLEKVVYLFGEFNNPINASYDPTYQVDDYLRLAGGLNEASNTKMIIISPDGTTQTFTPSFLKLSRPVIYPGTIIYSGKDVGRLDGLQFSATLAPILSSLAISLASLNSINN